MSKCSREFIRLLEAFEGAVMNRSEMPGYDKQASEAARKVRAYVASLEAKVRRANE